MNIEDLPQDDFLKGILKVVEGLNLMIGRKGLAKYLQVHIGSPTELNEYIEALAKLIEKDIKK